MGSTICNCYPSARDYSVKIAVSGATGFVGRYIIAELEKRSITPILLIRPSSTPLLLDIKYTIVSVDLSSLHKGNLFEYIGKPDILIHCAWAGLPNYNSRHHYENELPIQYNFLTQLIKNGLENLLVTGTCFEYGMQTGALHEDVIPQPSNPYGLAKNTLLQQLKYFQLSYK